MLARLASCNLSAKQIRPVFLFCGRRTFSKNSKDNLISDLQHDNTILKVLNYNSANYLSRYKIPISQVNELQLHKEKHGLYESLQDVLKVEGMTESILNEFLYSFVNDKHYKKMKKVKKATTLPKLDYISQKKISTVLGIYVGVNVVTWTLLDVQENVLEWNYENSSNISDNSTTLSILEMAWQLNNKLPKSDVYVMDDTCYDHRIIKSIRHMKPFLQKQQLRAMTLAFLKTRDTDAAHTEETESKYIRKLYITQHEKVANLYGLRIGNEVTSSAMVMNKLLYKRDNVSSAKENPIAVYVSTNIMDNYKKQLDYIQDQMNWSLLTALTFLQLSVHEKYNCDFF